MLENGVCFRVTVTFVRANGERLKAEGKVGDSLLDIVVNNELDLDGYGERKVLEMFVYFSLNEFKIQKKIQELVKER